MIPLATIALGFGLLVIPYLMLEWVATPAVALVMGIQSRWWSVPATLVFGVPLVVLLTVITPVVGSGSESLNVPVPWLAVYSKSKSSIMPILRERLLWWGALYTFSLLVGWASRRVLPPSENGG
ncbi:hypothetical protein [Roseateles sp.]|uniref:hypothetical protein n=1 Tax=Roseateles sp. TaxID=1971397 RepID=UPI003263A2C4